MSGTTAAFTTLPIFSNSGNASAKGLKKIYDLQNIMNLSYQWY